MIPLRLGSVCSGIGGAELAFAGLAEAAFMAETDPFARAVLSRHFPEVLLHGDFTAIEADCGPVDVLVAGTPCQSFSTAGKRRGLADPRGSLAFAYLALAERLRSRWVLWENVPGVLSSDGGRDLGAFVGRLGQLGYGWAYRCLDAQYFDLAQRRCRVFVVGCLGDWRRAAEVLFEPASLRWDPAPRRQAAEDFAEPLAASPRGGSGYRLDADTTRNLIAPTLRSGNSLGDHDGDEGLLVAATLTQGTDSHGKGGYAGRRREDDTNLVAYGGNNTAGPIEIATACNAHGGPHGRLDFESETFVTHTLCADGFDAGEDGTGRGTPLVAFQSSQSGVREVDTHATLDANNGSRRRNGIATASLVRRLTPTECERLQGYPDGWTAVEYRSKPAADGPRYRAIGNAFAVPVVRWIARRIALAEARAAIEVAA